MFVDVKKDGNFYRAAVGLEWLDARQTLDLLRASWTCSCNVCVPCRVGKEISSYEGKGDASDGSNLL